MKKPEFIWDPETGSALCVISNKNETYYGTAQCHPDDRDMMSEKTGCEIAYMRACLSVVKNKKNKLQNELQGLKKFYYSIKNSKYFNENHYETKKLITNIKTIENDVAFFKELIQAQKNNINTFLSDKENFYQKIRANRKTKNNIGQN